MPAPQSPHPNDNTPNDPTGTLPVKRSFFGHCWHVCHYFVEFLGGLIRFRRLHNCITVYGSARIQAEHPYYTLATQLGSALVKADYMVMTGGGPGLMSATNKGAHQAGGLAIGCCINIPGERHHNGDLDLSYKCHHFFVRKFLLSRYSCGFIALPGGFGTLDELFEMVTLIKTNHSRSFPIVLMVKDYWQPLIDYMRNTLIPDDMIEQQDLDLFFLTDSIEAAVKHLQTYPSRPVNAIM